MIATHIINRLPTPVLSYKSPFECLHNDIPDYSLFKVFGCVCYASVHDTDNFDPRVIHSVFIGYRLNHKGYKLLNLENKQQFISRDIVFHESIFPYHNNTHTSSPSDPYFLQHWMSDN